MEEVKQIDFGKALLKVLELIIVKPFTLPFQIYKSALLNLANSDSLESEEKVLSSEFPLFTWFIRMFDALIAIIYPIGIILALIAGLNKYTGGFGSFLGMIAATYFAPLGIGLVRELYQLSLKMVLYLKIISKK
ncbi:MAG: hypothetical protein CMC05_08430 [Flavobacteriaceae bacterium]|jgi:hypothetical protein|nr:hypothetical protein [Flavobacteriaceae bacterium]MBD10235.1 hypothetical protein [Flavobacteriaceae bacterium]|tara:strand:- start:397 stop:798 length:402 start_codon:yes stop_codon:yes gene_type:complete